MNTTHRLVFAFSTLVGAAALAGAALTGPARPASADTAASGPNMTQLKALYSEKCSACHNLPDAAAAGKTRAQWQRTVNSMLTQHHASDSISPAEAAQIVDYLATFAPRRQRRGARVSDPWATDALDVWSATPSATRVFNFETGGLPSGLATLSAGAPGPSPVWQIVPLETTADGHAARVSLRKPSPGRFALLMDRANTGRNLDVKVRFQIRAGKVSPAVGIVFGFTNPTNYSVLRYDAAKNDLALIQIAEPTHTTVQETPLNLPVRQTATLVASAPIKPALGDGWHTLRLLVSEGQVRGWLDMNKRISTQDAAYTGGQVGLWAQGDTVAVFDDWTVDIYDAPPTPQAAPPA